MLKFLKRGIFYKKILIFGIFLFSIFLFSIFQYFDKNYYKYVYQESEKIANKCKMDSEKIRTQHDSEIKVKDEELAEIKKESDKILKRQEKKYQERMEMIKKIQEIESALTSK